MLHDEDFDDALELPQVLTKGSNRIRKSFFRYSSD